MMIGCDTVPCITMRYTVRHTVLPLLVQVSAFALDMVTFKMILMGKAQDDHKDYLEFLKVRPLRFSRYT